MDVERYRRYKSLTGTSQNLRDHMSDLELALVTLGETVAVGLHQARGSNSFQQLAADSIDAGKVVAQTRRQIERLSGRALVQPGNHLPGARMVARNRRPKRQSGRPLHPGETAGARPELAERAPGYAKSHPIAPGWFGSVRDAMWHTGRRGNAAWMPRQTWIALLDKVNPSGDTGFGG